MSKMRSPNYPACGLDDAVAMARSFWTKEQSTAVSSEVAAKAIGGYQTLSGPARTALAALKKFGLLSEDKHGVRISPLALRILHPESDEDRIEALQEAALKPELFKQLAETHLRASDDALKSYLITKKSFSETGAKTFIDAFRDTMGFAKLAEWGYSSPADAANGESMEVGSQGGKGEVRTAGGMKALRTFSWPLSAETTARLEIVGNEELTSTHIEALAQYLEVAKRLLKPAKS